MKLFARFSFVSAFALAFVLALPALKLYAQKPFEGTVTWNITMQQMGDDDPHTMTMNIKGDKTESELDLGTMGMMKSYKDIGAGKEYDVMVAMHSGYTRDLQSDSAVNANQSKIEVKATGKTQTIAGHSADEYTFKDGPLECSVWASKDFSSAAKSFGKQIQREQQDPGIQSAMKQLIDKGMFPVRFVISKDGEVAMSMEFVKYEEKKLNDSIFVVPTDIKFQPMPHMPAGGGTN